MLSVILALFLNSNLQILCIYMLTIVLFKVWKNIILKIINNITNL